jgi:hypothetical protein
MDRTLVGGEPRSPTAFSRQLDLSHPTMNILPDDTFTVTSSTALGMAESLVDLLNRLVLNLPEAELHVVRAALEQSVGIADELLQNISISSTFETLSVDDRE